MRQGDLGELGDDFGRIVQLFGPHDHDGHLGLGYITLRALLALRGACVVTFLYSENSSSFLLDGFTCTPPECGANMRTPP